MRLKEYTLNANTGLDAIKRAPILDTPTDLRCIRITDISQGNDYEEWGYTEVSESDYKKFKLKKNDILVARTGATVGVSYIVKEDYNAVYNNGTIRLKLKNDIDADFVYHLFQTKSFRDYIDNISCVATQPNLRIEGLLKYDIPDFSKEKQEKISSVLNKYNELIQLNNKRIKLLEQTAQEIYKEWFVRFRFPGYEKATFKESLPKGWVFGSIKHDKIPTNWNYDSFDNIGSFKRGKVITKADLIDGDIPVVSSGVEPIGYHNQANVFGESITISASGNAGYLDYCFSDIWACDCLYCQDKNCLWFLYNTLTFLQPVLYNLQSGSAQQHVYPKDINNISILLPDKDIIKKYCEVVKPVYEMISTLDKQNRNLTEQHDCLLPRLMSGKLEV